MVIISFPQVVRAARGLPLVPPLAPPSLRVGKTLVGAKWNYRLAKRLTKRASDSTIFEAEVLPGRDSNVPAKWALIKTTTLDNDVLRGGLIREYNAYLRPSIAASPHIRAMYDFIGNPLDLNRETNGSQPDDSDAKETDPDYIHPCLVLERLDSTLTKVSSEQHRQNHILIEAIMKASLSGLVTLSEEGLVHSNLKPANILISGLNTDNPTVKLGDLSLAYPDGEVYKCQPHAMRAPEVHRHLPCIHRSDIWALAVTLFDWIKPAVFGIADNINIPLDDAWAIAKLMKLFPGWTGPPDNDREVRSNFECASAIVEEGDQYIKVSSLEDEMQAMDISEQLKDLFRYLFVVDAGARPSAGEALTSKEYLALRAAAARMRMGK